MRNHIIKNPCLDPISAQKIRERVTGRWTWGTRRTSCPRPCRGPQRCTATGIRQDTSIKVYHIEIHFKKRRFRNMYKFSKKLKKCYFIRFPVNSGISDWEAKMLTLTYGRTYGWTYGRCNSKRSCTVLLTNTVRKSALQTPLHYKKNLSQ